MRLRAIATVLIIASLAHAVSAANMTKILPDASSLIVNQTTIFPAPYHTPLAIFLVTVFVGLAAFTLSILTRPETPFDMFAYVAPIFMLFSTLMATGIDIKTSAAAGVLADGTITVIENHTIYTDVFLLIALAIMTGITVLNVFRVQAKKAEGIVEAPD